MTTIRKVIDSDKVETIDLLLATQRALLGAISNEVLGISVAREQSVVELRVFVEDSLSEEKREALEIVSTEIMADFGGLVLVNILVTENAPQPLKSLGTWVFLRYGCLVQS